MLTCSTISAAEETAGKAEVTRALSTVPYEVSVLTSDVSGAGTDANVSICLFGENGDSGDRLLRDSATHKNKFERNQTDVFTVRPSPHCALTPLQLECLDLGKLRKLRIWHDNKGLGAAWHLGYVSIKNTASGATTRFPCQQWLSKSDGDKQISRELTAEEN